MCQVKIYDFCRIIYSVCFKLERRTFIALSQWSSRNCHIAEVLPYLVYARWRYENLDRQGHADQTVSNKNRVARTSTFDNS